MLARTEVSIVQSAHLQATSLCEAISSRVLAKLR